MENTKVEVEREWSEFHFDVPWGHVSGKWYGDQSQQPILALHGWQDNAASFDLIVKLLPPSMPILCIEFPGHGKSSHLPPGMNINVFWSYVLVVRRIVKHYKWKKLRIIGHSMGGGVTFVYAACFPEDVMQYANIDIYGPLVRPFDVIMSEVRSNVEKRLETEALPESKRKTYTYEELVRMMLYGYAGSIDRNSAEILLTRSKKEIETENGNGFIIGNDFRLRWVYWAAMSLEQVLLLADRIRCHVLNIRAVPGLKLELPDVHHQVLEAIGKNAITEYAEVPGTHQVHMGAPEAVAKVINNFFLNPK